jgi:CheY-like chemotaxis protein
MSTRSEINRFLCVTIALGAGAFAQRNGAQAPRECPMTKSCNSPYSPRDCSPLHDTRSCGHDIELPFNGRIHVNDPVCEAAKAAQNQNYQVQSQACEARREADKAESEWNRHQCLVVANACSDALSLAESSKFVGAKLLWVDDRPDNNVYERQALINLGATVTTVIDTDQAMAQLSSKIRFDAIITDFARTRDPKAGYTLLGLVRKLSDPPPLVIYSASSTPAFVAEAVRRGAVGETNQPTELIKLVVRSATSRRQRAGSK